MFQVVETEQSESPLRQTVGGTFINPEGSDQIKTFVQVVG